MISEKDLHDAIAECQGERHPNANTCIKLAAYLTILDTLYPSKTDAPVKIIEKPPVKEVENTNIIGDLGDTEFYKAVKGKDINEVMAVFNELMDTVYVMNKRLYDGVMHQLL